MHELIDISGHQRMPDFAAVKDAGIKGVIIKATEGVTFANPLCAGQQYRARSHDLRTGFYHFLHPRRERSGAAEADWFYRHVRGIRAGDGDHAQLMRLVADVETSHIRQPDGSMDREGTRRYIRQFEERLRELAGHAIVLYTFPTFLANWGAQLGALRLWIAHPGVPDPALPEPFTGWAMHQYTWTAAVPGVDGDCDSNRCPALTELTLDRPEY